MPARTPSTSAARTRPRARAPQRLAKPTRAAPPAAGKSPAYVLGSYHYFRERDIGAMLERERVRGTELDFLADSGAFSALHSGAVVTTRGYARWLLEHHKSLTAAISMDVIGDADATYRNTQLLRELTEDRVPLIPTFHAGSPFHALERLAAQYSYISLGGAKHLVTGRARLRELMAWATRCHLVAREHGSRIHGLGLTGPEVASRLPWYSVDSSAWNIGPRYGMVHLWDPRVREHVAVNFGVGQAGSNLHRHTALLRSYGVQPARLAIPGFSRTSIRGHDGLKDRVLAIRMGAESYLRFREYVRALHGPVSAPAGVRGEGFKLYLSVSVPGYSFGSQWRALCDHHVNRDLSCEEYGPGSAPEDWKQVKEARGRAAKKGTA